MNVTEIYTSRKLESIIPEALIQKEFFGECNPLGKWSATVFYVSRKKCLLITNSITRYSVFIPGISKSDFKNLSEIFIDAFIEQLKRDGVTNKSIKIRSLIGEVTLHKTDNNRAIIGTQNYILENIDVWKYEFGPFDNWDFKDINRRVNGIPYKQLGWLYPRERMRLLLEEIVIVESSLNQN